MSNKHQLSKTKYEPDARFLVVVVVGGGSGGGGGDWGGGGGGGVASSGSILYVCWQQEFLGDCTLRRLSRIFAVCPCDKYLLLGPTNHPWHPTAPHHPTVLNYFIVFIN